MKPEDFRRKPSTISDDGTQNAGPLLQQPAVSVDASSTTPPPPVAGQPAPSKFTRREDIPDWGDKPKRKWPKRLIAILIVLLLLGGAGTAAYMLFVQGSKENRQAANTPPPPTAPPPPSALDNTSETFVSAALGLEFEHPASWEVKEVGSSKTLTITSPEFDLDNMGDEGDGVFIQITIAPQTVKSPEYFNRSFDVGAASEQLMYTAPTEAQRAETYLSFFSTSGGEDEAATGTATETETDSGIADDSTETANLSIATGFDTIFVTGGQTYSPGDFMNGSKLKEVDPIIEIAVACQKDSPSCTPSDRTAITTDVWEVEAVYTKVRELIASFRFQ